MILSMAMLFQSVPVYAAENQSAVEASLTEDINVEEAMDDGKTAQAEVVPEEDVNGETVTGEEDLSGTESDGTMAGEAGSNDAVLEQTETGNADTGKADPVLEEDSSHQTAPEENNSGVGVKSEDKDATGTADDEKRPENNTVTTSTEDIQAVIKISDELSLPEFKREIGTNEQILFSTQYAQNRFNRVQEIVNKNVSVHVDDEKLDGLNAVLDYTWEVRTKKADETPDGKEVYSPLDIGVPEDAGEYRLHIQVPDIKGLCKGNDTYIYFSVSKRQLKPRFVFYDEGGNVQKDLLAVNSADTVGEFRQRLVNEYEFDAPDTDKKNIIDNITFNVYEVSKDAVRSEKPLGDEVSFYYSRNYIVTAEKPELNTTANNNYEVLFEEYYVINVSRLIETEITIELNEPGKEYVKEYDGEPVDISIIGVKKDNNIELVIVNKVKDGKLIEIPTAKAVPAWYTRSNAVENNTPQINDYVYTELDEAPKDAGEYFVRYKYVPEGEEADLYEGSESDPIKVTIEPKPLLIKPEAIEVFEGMTEEELEKALAEVEYKLTYKGNEITYDSPDEKKEFFGVAYSGDGDKARTQYYQPEFELQVREKTAAEGEDEIKFDDDDKWVNVVPKHVPLKASMENKKEKRQYRVKFTGNKVLYDRMGHITDRVLITDLSTNSANKNHIVQSDEVLPKEITKLESTRIEVKPIIDSFTSINTENKGTGSLSDPAFKVYDTDALFGSAGKRSDYKKAVLYENEQATDIKDTSDELTYIWYSSTLDKYEEYMAEDEDGRKKFESEDRWEWEKANIFDNVTDPDDGTLLTPADSGFYRLEIQYKDPEGEKLSASADVYFFIKQQEVIVAAENRYVTDGERWDDDTIKQPPLLYTIYEVPNNDIDTFNKIYAENRSALKVFKEFDEDSSLNLTWNVRREKWGTDGKPETGGNQIYEKIWEQNTGSQIILYGNRKYQAYAYIADLDANPQYKNYTCEIRPVAAADRADDQKTYRYWPGDILFTEGRLDVSIDPEKMPHTRPYDGNPIITDPADLKKLITVKNADGEDLTEQLLNTEAEYGKDLVNVRWVWEYLEEEDQREPYQTIYGEYQVVPTQEAIYGGTYYLAVEFAGNETYAAYSYNAYEEKNAENKAAYSCRITKRPITITPKLNEGLKAGQYVSELYGFNPETGTDERLPVSVENLVEKDSGIFAYKELEGRYVVESGGDYWLSSYKGKGYPAFYHAIKEKRGYDFDIAVNMDTETLTPPYDETYLRCGRTYDVKFTGELAYPWKSSYEVTYQSARTAISERGKADITGTDFLPAGGGAVDVRYEYDAASKTYTIVPREGIRFFYEEEGRGLLDVNGDVIPFTDGNYVAFQIYVPREFEGDVNGTGFDAGKFIAKNNVKQAGGYVLQNLWERDFDDQGQFRGHILKVLFPVKTDENGNIINEKPNFTITWEGADQGTDQVYTEKFELDLKDIALEADLKKAVAPKSLAFNGVNAKMAVGEEQQLDVKIKKAQLGDIIYLNYRLDGNVTRNEYLSVDPETGRITALKATKTPVTVEAYPVYRAEDGTVQEIKNGAKTAKTKITITPVTAPVIKKITVLDTAAEIQYTPVSDGYRREIFVKRVDDKAEVRTWNKEKFEEEIGRMKNGQWQGIFDLAPIYRPDRNDSIQRIPHLKPNTTYVVYVRNVSAVRTLDDGSKVTFCASGNVKSFATTKSMVQELEPYFTVNDGAPDKKNPVTFDGDRNYTVELQAKSAQLSVYGLFKEREEAGKEAADEHDLLRYSLPLKSENKELLNYYAEPKLTYVVSDDQNEVFEAADFKQIQSKYATVSNKGKIALKGVDLDGTATVWLSVISDNDVVGQCSLTITAEPDSVAGSKIKMKVGDTIALADCLQYKQAGKKVPFYRSSRMKLVTTKEEALEQGYRIEQIDKQFFITAVKPNKNQFKLKVTDDNIGADAEITLTSAQLDPVKKLKVSYVDNQQITINFAHAGSPEAFEILVKDARGSVVSRDLVQNDILPWDGLRYVSADAPAYKQRQQQWIINDDQFLCTNTLAYFEKTQTYSYTIKNSKIVRLSSYSISVTPVYELNRAAKDATTKVKTTDIPARNDTDLDAVSWVYGGIPVNYSGVQLAVSPYFTSGNTYTLDSGLQTDARDRVTDTLTWKSSNTKVASIKAIPGTYTATFKALTQGTTTIEVSSKITKKVIARYMVRIKAVGKGQPVFGGDYEPSWDSAFYRDVLAKWDPLYQGRLEVLTLSNDVTVSDADNTICDGTWVSFTAPKFGRYTFTRTGDANGVFMAIYDGRNLDDVDARNVVNGATQIDRYLEAGQKVYLKLSGNFTLSVEATEFAGLSADNTKDNPLVIKNNEWISFKAPIDNYYIFSGVDVSRFKVSDDQNPIVENTATDNNGPLSIVLKEGTTLFMQVRSTDNTESTSRLWVDYAKDKLSYEDKKEEVEVVLSKEDNARFVKFTAPETQKYQFSYEETAGLGLEYLIIEDNMDGDRIGMTQVVGTADDKKIITNTFELVKGQTIVFRFTANNEAFADKVTAVRVKIKVAFDRVIELRTDKDASVEHESTKMVFFDVPENGKYIFRTQRTDTSAYFSEVLDNDLKQLTSFPARSWSFGMIVNDTSAVKKGDRIYLRVRNDNKETDADAGDALVTVEKVPVASLQVGTDKEQTVTDRCGEYWYTFTAQKAGFYEFGAAYKNSTQEKAAYKHTVNTTTQYDKVFGTVQGSLGISLSTTGTGEDLVVNANKAKRYMQAGETLTFALNTTWCGKDDRNADVKTNITVRVTELGLKAILADSTPEHVSIGAENEEVYYAFTAKEADDYTITFVPGKDIGTYEMYVTDDLNGSWGTQMDDDHFTQTLGAGQVRYIIIKSTDAEKAVSGDLKVTSTRRTETALESDVRTPFELKPDETKYYTFTATENSEVGLYSIVTEVQEDKDQLIPFVTVEAKGKSGEYRDIWTPYDAWPTYEEIDAGYEMFKKGDTLRIRITNYEDSNVSGTIMVGPVRPVMLDSEQKPVVVYGKQMWYKYSVPGDGRYKFPVSLAETATEVNVTYLLDSKVTGTVSWEDYNLDGRYLHKGDMVYMLVSTGEDSEQHLTLGVPEKITPAALKIEEKNEIEVKKGETKYYEYTAQEDGYYRFVPESIDPSDSLNCYCYKRYAQWDYTYEESDAIYIRKGESLFFRVEAPKEVDIAGTLAVTNKDIYMLKNGEASGEVELEPWETAYFAYMIYDPGMYAFRSMDVETEGTSNLQGVFQFGDRAGVSRVLSDNDFNKGFYYLRRYTEESTQADQLSEVLRVTNTTGDTVKFKVRADRIEPAELVADDEGEGIPVDRVDKKENKYTFFTFKAPERARYRIAADSKDVTIRFISQSGSISREPDRLFEKNEEVLFVMTYTGSEEKTENVTVSAKKVRAEAANGTQHAFTVPANDVVWLEYTFADPSKIYSFTLKEGEEKTYTALYTSDSILETPEKTNKIFTTFAREKIFFRIQNASNADVAYVLDVKDKAAIKAETLGRTEKLTFTTFGQVELLTYTVEAESAYQITGVVADDGNFSVKYYNEKGVCLKDMSADGSVPQKTMNTEKLKPGEKIYIKVYPYFQQSHDPEEAYAHDVTITIDKIVE